MKKKILLFIVIIMSSFLIIPANNVYAMEYSPTSIYDEKIAIELIKDGNTIEIKHTSGRNINYAIVEYAYYDNGRYISMLDTFKVSNNIFTINKGVNVHAVKVHQIKELRNNIYYTYSTSNQNSVGSFNNVERIAIVEIQTTHVQTITTDIHTSSKIGSPLYKYYEFYFDFDKTHDQLISIDVDYIVTKYNFWGLIKGESYNVNNNINVNDYIELNGYEFVKIPGLATPAVYPKSITRKALSENTQHNIPGNYVARISANTNWLSDNYKVENFAIIRIEYTIDGEFYIDEVINDPSTPIDDKINDLNNLLNQIQNYIERITNVFNNISAFISGNSPTIIKISLIIVALIVWALLSPIIRLVFNAIKTLFNLLIKGIASILSIFF